MWVILHHSVITENYQLVVAGGTRTWIPYAHWLTTQPLPPHAHDAPMTMKMCIFYAHDAVRVKSTKKTGDTETTVLCILWF